MLHMDFEMGQILRDNVVPYALFHFTQEMEDEDDDFDDEEEDFEDEVQIAPFTPHLDFITAGE